MADSKKNKHMVLETNTWCWMTESRSKSALIRG